ncbi:hypothetical protein CONPUDRAFT_65902 [Coniophora puteana RWD-64-598 SS2]|uniref:2OGFeDO JBP1/TET oxygenase domain-containing protein n=1 Tax=Coniophora puteana (strain RWD-64-598) TaxID=741705 RepID=A0A5M3M8F1_CONPW|nr:uncharacterized protein CONPUDRAFT_65902 [Coniophora puteana RWD-64-598 SS2]EIW75449.1 hypothetical protein CONPUDRAFT_65902 [Coniophora puteana RWD-64-598 SS2]
MIPSPGQALDKLPDSAFQPEPPQVSYPPDNCPFYSPDRDANTGRLLAVRPCKLVDLDGLAVAWFLPDVLSTARQAEIIDSLRLMGGLMADGIKQNDINDARNSSLLFKPAADCNAAGAGCINISPAWQMLGHETEDWPPKASANWQKNKTALSSWVAASRDVFALISAILSIVHPEQYRQGILCMKAMAQKPGVGPFASLWASAFNAATIIANRETLFHWDRRGRHWWFDILATCGKYTDGQFSLPATGIDFHYRPGTVVPFCGNVLCHAVPHCIGERICLAFYMRDVLHRIAKTGDGSWSKSIFTKT